jgi:hypothetical protein
VPSGTWLAIRGKFVRLLPTIPLMRPANVFKWRAKFPCADGKSCVKVCLMAR